MSQATAARDAFFMARALELADKGRYTTKPNPRVGCVIVRDDAIIAEGWHAKVGGPHAEVDALSKVGNATKATAYVTLEPCSHHGKTPPCCDALIKAGISRVVAAMEDPNPLVSGSGLERLKNAGIEVSCDVLKEPALALNRGFIKRMTENRPFVRSKLAMSLDGRTALASGESKWITSEQARADVHLLRAESAAILTGINTLLCDDPLLNARVDFDFVPPIRVVLDPQLKTPTSSRMLSVPGRCLILTCQDNPDKTKQLQAAGFEVYCLEALNSRLDLQEVLKFLAGQQINDLLIEAGPILNGAFLEENRVDEYVVYMASCLLGDQGRGLFHLPQLKKMTDKKNLILRDVRQIGQDLKLILTTQ